MSASRTAGGRWRLPGRRSAAAARALAVSVAVAVVTAGARPAGARPPPGRASPALPPCGGGGTGGAGAGGGTPFRGLPYAAPPTGNLRWRPPQPAAAWTGVRPATQFGPSCPQALEHNPFLPPGPISEDCLYLNVYAPAAHS